jgi:hypothetical protein
MFLERSKIFISLGLVLALTLTGYGADTRTKLKPGFNLFSPEQDVEMGRDVARQAESQLSILNDRRATAYIDALGKKLAAHAPGEKYPYQFKIVNDQAINAFALPGGFVYINRGVLEAADDEAQVAGVLAHEISHVALRHGTNQASKAYITQAPLAVLGGTLGGGVGGVLAQLGISFATSSLLLKYSRTAETQADLMGTQILHDSGYDPDAMVQFFEKIQAESKGRAIQFFSDHPNPENRIGNVQKEIERLGGAPANARKDSPDFHTVKTSLAGMPAPRGSAAAATRGGTTDSRNGRPQAPSGRMTTYNGRDIQISYPDNWRQYGQGSALTIAPDGGIINGSLAYGMIMSTFDTDEYQGRLSLEQARDQLLNNLRQSNPDMRITRSHERIRVGGQAAYLTEAMNTSPAGGRETDWIVTTITPDNDVYYFVAVAPQTEFRNYSRSFDDILDSVRFR